MSMLSRCGRPWLVIVGDDHDTSDGPSKFDRLQHLCRLAHAVAIYTGLAEAKFCLLFAATVTIGGKVLVAETQGHHHGEWSAFLREAAPRAARIEILPEWGTA
jgi:hypothetical protein